MRRLRTIGYYFLTEFSRLDFFVILRTPRNFKNAVTVNFVDVTVKFVMKI